jgi:cytoskeletal protein CcmA (bactofilin family)
MPSLGRTWFLDSEKPDIQNRAGQNSAGQNRDGDDSPRIDLSQGARADIRLPLRPFNAKPASKINPFFKDPKSKASPSNSLAKNPGKISHSRGTSMSDRFSTDRMAAFTPQVQKRVADIPNLAAMRTPDADTEGKRLVIGKQIRISGEIAGCEKLVVEGKVDATISDVKSIEVTTNGYFKGNAEVESAVIAGTYEGSLKVHGHLEIAPSGVVKGGVSYKTIAVANGGKLLGTIETIDG